MRERYADFARCRTGVIDLFSKKSDIVNSKIQMASVSLVGAIPGLALSVVLVMALVSYFGNMTIMTGTLAGLTLLVSVGLAMLPVVIMVFGSKTVKDESAVDEEASEGAVAAEEEAAEEEELTAADAADEEEFDLDEDAADEPDDFSGDADDVFMEGDEDEFDMSLFEDEK